MVITQNQIKHTRSLQQKKYRQEFNQFIIEGFRTIDEALMAKGQITDAFIEESLLENSQYHQLVHLLTQRNIPIYKTSQKQMKEMSDTKTPSGILAVCSIPKADDKAGGNWLYLDEISDPGNAGTLLRTAAWFNVPNVCFSKGCVDPYSPKTVRSGMGAHFYLNILVDTKIDQISSNSIVLGAGMEGEEPSGLEINEPWILALGSEAHGLSDQISPHIDTVISIPKLGNGESLNVAVAGGIIIRDLTKK